MGAKPPSLKILVIGALPPPVGGATLLVQNLIEELQERPAIEVLVIDLSRAKETMLNRVRSALGALRKMISLGRQVDVITFHANQYGRLIMGPFVYIISRVLHKPLIVRAFGGSFDQQYEALPTVYQWVMRRTYFNAEICLLETKHVLAFFKTLPIRRAEWFPNYTRGVSVVMEKPLKQTCRRFIFLGRVTPAKGIEEMFSAGALLDEGVTLEIYGPLDAHYTLEQMPAKESDHVKYSGALSRSEIAEKLWEYDALVLPTYWHGEGYPAVVLEAYAHGLPVITTTWQSIPEIVDERSGILIEPKDATKLAEAMNGLHRDPGLYRQLQLGARERIKEFSDDIWIERFFAFCNELAGRAAARG